MSRRSNFTLIEILTVVVIISILTAIVLGVTHYATSKAHRSRTVSRLTALEQALDKCLEDRGYYPSTSGSVQLGESTDFSETTLSSLSPTWDLQKNVFIDRQTGGVYLEGYRGGIYLDSWGRPFLYRCDGSQHNAQQFDLWSAGPDGVSGTEDDITNWKSN